MNKKLVGSVTETEKNEIRRLYERKLALAELLLTLNEYLTTEQKDEIYEKVIIDVGVTKSLYDKWWRETAAKHGWESAEDKQWLIDFETNQIYLKAL